MYKYMDVWRYGCMDVWMYACMSIDTIVFYIIHLLILLHFGIMKHMANVSQNNEKLDFRDVGDL